MNKLQAIIAFVQVAERGGFTAAGRHLGMSGSAITKSIARLEDELGTQLFNRTTRSIALTDIGQEFYERCRRVVDDLEDAEAATRESTIAPRGLVKVAMPFSFGRVTVIPALPSFYRRYPDVVLDLHFSDLQVDIIKDGYDLAVWTGNLSDSRLIRRVLVQGPVVTVASPDYLEEHGTPQSPEDLSGHNCVIGRYGTDWPYRNGNALMHVRVGGNLMVQSGDALREAAANGIGIAQWTRWLFRRDIEAGRLKTILDDYAPEGLPVSVVYPDKRHLARKVAVVIDFLSEITRRDSDRALAAPIEDVLE